MVASCSQTQRVNFPALIPTHILLKQNTLSSCRWTNNVSLIAHIVRGTKRSKGLGGPNRISRDARKSWLAVYTARSLNMNYRAHRVHIMLFNSLAAVRSTAGAATHLLHWSSNYAPADRKLLRFIQLVSTSCKTSTNVERYYPYVSISFYHWLPRTDFTFNITYASH